LANSGNQLRLLRGQAPAAGLLMVTDVNLARCKLESVTAVGRERQYAAWKKSLDEAKADFEISDPAI